MTNLNRVIEEGSHEYYHKFGEPLSDEELYEVTGFLKDFAGRVVEAYKREFKKAKEEIENEFKFILEEPCMEIEEISKHLNLRRNLKADEYEEF